MAARTPVADGMATVSGGAERLECGVFHRRFGWAHGAGSEFATASTRGKAVLKATALQTLARLSTGPGCRAGKRFGASLDASN